ncbi:MAG: YiiX/YebB-like N1pC/P60 family cysteine hydrolase [Puniceicoccaceae bacterium]
MRSLVLTLLLLLPQQQKAEAGVRLPDVQSGDFVARNAGGTWSRFFASISETDRRFSHIGIAVELSGEFWVIHSKGDDWTGIGSVRRERLSDFIGMNGEASVAWGVFRRKGEAASGLKAAMRALEWEQAEIEFDSAFDLADASRLYCTEMIWRAYLESSGVDLVPAKRVLDGREIISIDCLTGQSGVVEVAGGSGGKQGLEGSR